MSNELAVFSALKHPLKIGTKLDINKNMQQTIEIVDCKWNEQENMYVYKCLVLSGKNNIIFNIVINNVVCFNTDNNNDNL